MASSSDQSRNNNSNGSGGTGRNGTSLTTTRQQRKPPPQQQRKPPPQQQQQQQVLPSPQVQQRTEEASPSASSNASLLPPPPPPPRPPPGNTGNTTTTNHANNSDNNLDSDQNRQRMERVIRRYERKIQSWSEAQIRHVLVHQLPAAQLGPDPQILGNVKDGQWHQYMINFLRMSFLRSIATGGSTSSSSSLLQGVEVRRKAHTCLQMLFQAFKETPPPTVSEEAATVRPASVSAAAASTNNNATAEATVGPATTLQGAAARSATSERTTISTATTTTNRNGASAAAAPAKAAVAETTRPAAAAAATTTATPAVPTMGRGRGISQTRPAWMTRNESGGVPRAPAAAATAAASTATTATASRPAAAASTATTAAGATTAGAKRKASEDAHQTVQNANGNNNNSQSSNKRRNMGDSTVQRPASVATSQQRAISAPAAPKPPPAQTLDQASNRRSSWSSPGTTREPSQPMRQEAPAALPHSQRGSTAASAARRTTTTMEDRGNASRGRRESSPPNNNNSETQEQFQRGSVSTTSADARGRRELSPSHHRDRSYQNDRAYPQQHNYHHRHDSSSAGGANSSRQRGSLYERPSSSSRDREDRDRERSRSQDVDRRGTSFNRDWDSRDRHHYHHNSDRDRYVYERPSSSRDREDRERSRSQDAERRGSSFNRDWDSRDRHHYHHNSDRDQYYETHRDRDSNNNGRYSHHQQQDRDRYHERDRQSSSERYDRRSSERHVGGHETSTGEVRARAPSHDSPKDNGRQHASTSSPSHNRASNDRAPNVNRNVSENATNSTGVRPNHANQTNTAAARVNGIAGSDMDMSDDSHKNKKTAPTPAPARAEPKPSNDDKLYLMENFVALNQSKTPVNVTFLAENGQVPYACYDKKHFPQPRQTCLVSFTPNLVTFPRLQEMLRRWQKFEPFWRIDWIAGMGMSSTISEPTSFRGNCCPGKTAVQLNVRLSDPQWPERGKAALRDISSVKWGSKILCDKKPSDDETRLLLISLPVEPNAKKRADTQLWPLGTFAQFSSRQKKSALRLRQRKQEQHDDSLWKQMCYVFDLTPIVPNPAEPFSVDIMSYDSELFYFAVCFAKYRTPDHLCADLKGEGPEAITKLPREVAMDKAVEFSKPTLCLDGDENACADEEGALVFSLKDHSTKLTIETPVRGRECKHFQCFDLLPYLKGNVFQFGQRWRCGVCEKFISPMDLVMCGLTADLAKEFENKVEANQDRIEVRSDRKYRLLDEKKGKKYSGRGGSSNTTTKEDPNSKPPARKTVNSGDVVEID